MYILGISSNVHISSAALIKDGVIVAAAPEERFSREKRSRRMPLNAIKFCLEREKISLKDVEYIAVANDPGIPLSKYNRSQSEVLRWYPEIFYQIPNSLGLIEESNYDGPMYLSYLLNREKCNIIYVSHHKCHMANAFYLSGYDTAAVFSADGRGEDGTVMFGMGNDSHIKIIDKMDMPYSLGLVYGTITDFLGYHHDGDEWKVMGMAAYSDWNNEYYTKIKKMFHFEENGMVTYDLSCFSYTYSDCMYTEKLIDILGKPRKQNEELTERHFMIAAATQKVIEEVVFYMLNKLYEKTQLKRLVVTGGLFMNSLLNGKIEQNTPFSEVFISSCPDDSGISIGAALYVYHEVFGNKVCVRQEQNYYGPEYENSLIETILKKDKLPVNYYCDQELYERIAELLSRGKVVGWFQGRMEFGQRALGNRSILADPRKIEMKDILNQTIKYREIYRPVAPAVLDEDFDDYFIGKKQDTYFMSKTVQATELCKIKAPVIVHNDGTSRVQVVEKDKNEKFYNLLWAFKKLTGIGMLVNTSFNVNGEPIVCSVEDAIKTFYLSGIDVLVIGNYIICK